MIAGSLRTFTTRHHTTPRRSGPTRWSRHLQAAAAGSRQQVTAV